MSDEELILAVKAAVFNRPEFALRLSSEMGDSIQSAFMQERLERCEWESIALTAMDARLFKGNKVSLANRIHKLRKTNGFNWEAFTKKMETQ